MFFETLESRQMMSVTLNSAGSLNILGTDGPDVITVRKIGAYIEVMENRMLHHFEAASVKRIIARLGAGDDSFAAKGSIHTRTALYGEAGNDDIRAGYGNDHIDGGEGNDRLNAQFGRDTLIGGSGRDVIDAVTTMWREHSGVIVIPFVPTNDDNHPDVIHADGDGERDEIRHNPNDTVHADPQDLLRPLEHPFNTPLTISDGRPLVIPGWPQLDPGRALGSHGDDWTVG